MRCQRTATLETQVATPAQLPDEAVVVVAGAEVVVDVDDTVVVDVIVLVVVLVLLPGVVLVDEGTLPPVR